MLAIRVYHWFLFGILLITWLTQLARLVLDGRLTQPGVCFASLTLSVLLGMSTLNRLIESSKQSVLDEIYQRDNKRGGIRLLLNFILPLVCYFLIFNDLQSNMEVIMMGLGVWTSCLFKLYDILSEKLFSSLRIPIIFGLISLPWELVLTPLNQPLIILGTDLGFIWVSVCSYLLNLGIELKYWDSMTFYSDQFYLIVDQSCAGVHILISALIICLGLSWIFERTLVFTIRLLLFAIPTGLFINGARIGTLHLMGHYGGEALAMGAWHQWSGHLWYVLFLLITTIVGLKWSKSHID